MKRILTVILSLTMITACAQGAGPKQTGGALLGGAAGAVAGAQFGKGSGRIATTAIGTLLGAALGSSIGQSLDQADMMYYNQTSQGALETAKSGTTQRWVNPDSGNSGTFTPLNVSQAGGMYCREYRQTINVGERVEEAYGTACRQPDGSWSIKN